MRLAFIDWTVEKGVVTMRRATCGPLTYAIVIASRDSATAWVCNERLLPTNLKDLSAAESACEAHLQAILDAAAAIDAEKDATP